MSVFSRLRQLFHRSSRRVSQRSARQSSLSQRHQRRSVLRAELLEERKLMASDLHYFVTTEHTDLASAYSGGWSLGVSEDIQGDLPLDETLVYVGTNAQLNRPTDPQWNFTGVPANALFYVGSQTQEDGFLYFGADASGVAPSLLNTTNVATESKNRITGNNKWVKYSLLDVDHFNPDGTPGTGNFSMWSSGSFGTPLVLMSSYNDGTANPNGNGLDVTDGISSDDALWLPAGGHVHYNFGFTQAGRYEVHLQTSANFVSGGVIASDPMDPFILYFSVGSVGQLEFDNASYSVDESAGSATIRVERVGGSDGEITVDYAMAGVSATAGSDFTSSSGTLTFADKETEKLITIPIINDTDSESDETISLSLSLPGPEIIEAHYDAFESRSLLGAQSTAVLTILANDTTSNTPPSISDIGDQATQEDTATNSIAFTVNDAQTAAAALIVTATSSNPTLVPNGNIVLGGSGANRTVTITPAPNQFGNTTITLTVTDEGGLTATDTFLLTVNSVNDAPTISDIGDQSTDEDTPTGNIPFTIGDVETAAGALEVTFTSSNTTLVPIGNIVLGGSGANRNVVVTPQAHQAGTALITARVTDAGGLTTSDTFTLTVGAINDAPTISDVGNQSTDEDTSTGEIAFTVDDFETATGSLVVTATSSNATLVPNANIVLGGSGANRTVTITPAANLSGSTTITLTVTDAGGLTATDSFLLTVNPVNDLPTISDISDRFVLEGSSTGPIPFSVGDLETPAADLVVTATSSNQAIIPNGNIVFGGSGSNRTISLTSIDNQAGTSIITVTVTDASGGQASDTFVLTAGDLVRATFDRSALIVNATNPTDVRLADMDNDGDLDVLFASYITSISFLPSNGDGTFGTEVTLPALTVSDIHVADVDGDSLLDIVSSVYVDSTYAETAISVWRNLGGGSFSGRAIVESTRTTAFVGLVGVGDVDGDGLNDLVLSNNGLSWSRNQVGGTFGAVSTISTGGINYSSVLEDIDQDGDLDIVEAALVSDNFRLQVYRNSGTSNPSFTAEQIASFGSNAIRNIAIGDTNQDGFDDIHLLRGGSNRDIVALHGTSSGTFQAPVVLGSGSNLTDLEIGEIDGDGRPDLALTAQEQNQVLFAQNLGGGVFTELQEFSHDGSSLNPYPEAVAIGDLDLDGRNDLVFSERFGNGIAWSRNRSEENITELVPPASRTYLNGYD